MQSHRWEDLLPEEFYYEFERAPLAYMAAGPPEEHGLHCPLGSDLWPPYQICLRAAEITGGIVFPIIPFAPPDPPATSREQMRSGKYELFPPSLYVSRELCELAYTEVLEGMADLGFRACICMAGHTPAGELLQEMMAAHGGVIRGMRFYGTGTDSIISDLLDEMNRERPGSANHGTLWETSMIMAVAPEHVDLPRARRIPDDPRPSQLHVNSPEVIAMIQEANAELGEKMLGITVERIVAKAEELLAGVGQDA